MAVWTITCLTVREAARRRLLLALAGLTLITALGTGWGFHKIMEISCTGPCAHGERTAGIATLLIMLMFMFSFVIAMAAAFVSAPSIATEAENGVLLSLLPRPIRRSDVLVGKWLGLGLVVASYTAVCMALEFVIVKLATGYGVPHPVSAIVYVVAEGIIVLTISLTLSTRLPAMAAGIIVLGLFGVVWVGGVAGSIGAVLHNPAVAEAGTITSLILPTDGLWRGAMYSMEPAALLGVAGASTVGGSGNPFLASSVPAAGYHFWVLAWFLVILGSGIWMFERRDL